MINNLEISSSVSQSEPFFPSDTVDRTETLLVYEMELELGVGIGIGSSNSNSYVLLDF